MALPSGQTGGEPADHLLPILVWMLTAAFHSHPLELVDRLLLDQSDVLQDASDVIDPLCAASCSCHQLTDIHEVVR